MSEYEQRAAAARRRAVWVAARQQQAAEKYGTRAAWERAAGAWADLVLLAPSMKLSADATLSWRAARREIDRLATEGDPE